MTELREPVAARAGRILLIAAVIVAAAATAWFSARYRDEEVASRCSGLYHAAVNATDSAAVDSARPTALGARRDALDGVDCGTLRRLGKIR